MLLPDPPDRRADAGAEASEGPARDLCPGDPEKRAPGTCGCGRRELDSDLDGTPDCADACPRDSRKTAPGACGCDAPEADADGDGAPDCVDACPADAHKTSAGVCGCDHSEPEDVRAGSLYCARSQLRHRYSFNDPNAGTLALDSVSLANGTIVGGLLADGSLVLTGDQGPGYLDEAHVSLPAAVWAGLRSATIECWVTWDGQGAAGGTAWQRIFDFGTANQNIAHSYIYLTPEGKGGVRTAFSLDGNGAAEVSVVSPMPLPQHTRSHLAVVVDEPSARLSLYIDGVMQGQVAMTARLSDLTPSELWLGRSHFTSDPAFYGTIHELRIYTVALSELQLRASAELGPDYDFRP